MPLVWFYPPQRHCFSIKCKLFLPILRVCIRHCTIPVSLPGLRRTLRQPSLYLRDILPHNNHYIPYQHSNRNRNRTSVCRMILYNWSDLFRVSVALDFQNVALIKNDMFILPFSKSWNNSESTNAFHSIVLLRRTHKHLYP